MTMLATKKLSVRFPRWILPVVWVVFALGCRPAGPQSLLEGQRLLREKQFPQAVEHLTLATTLMGTNAQAWNHLGLAYHGLGQPADALRAYQRALAHDSNLAAANYNLGCLHLEYNQPGAAVPALTTFTLLTNWVEGWLRLGSAQLRVGQFEGASNSFAMALRHQSDLPEALNGLGIVQVQRRRFLEASNLFKEALRLHPDYPPSLLNSAILAHHYLNQKAVALEKYRAYLTLLPPPPHWTAVEEAAWHLAASLQPPAASVSAVLTNQTIKPSATTNIATTNLASLAQFAAHQGKTNAPVTNNPILPPSLSVSKQTESITPAPTDPPLPESSTIESTLKTTVLIPSDTPGSKPGQASEFTVVKAPEEPLVIQPKSATSDPPGAGQETKLTGQIQAPSTATTPGKTPPVQAGRAARPSTPKMWLRSKEKPPTPLIIGMRSIPPSATGEIKPDSTIPAELPQKPAQADPLPSPPPPPRYSYLQPAKPSGGNRVEAARILNEGVAAQNRNQIHLAKEAYMKAVQLDQSLFEAQYNLGLVEYELDELSQSLKAYETALAINPNSLSARFNFALALHKADYPRDAADQLEKLVREFPEETRGHFLLANLYAERLVQKEAARRHYQRVLTLEPKHSQAAAIRQWLADNP